MASTGWKKQQTVAVFDLHHTNYRNYGEMKKGTKERTDNKYLQYVSVVSRSIVSCFSFEFFLPIVDLLCLFSFLFILLLIIN